MRETRPDATFKHLWPFLAGVAAGAVGMVITESLLSRRHFDLRLVHGSSDRTGIRPVVLVPGIMGSGLFRPDGTQVWLNLQNVFGAHDIRLPYRLPLVESTDDLIPAGLLGVDTVLPRLFGFTEYSELVDLLEKAGFRRTSSSPPPSCAYQVFAYDWRRDLVESARRLGDTLDALAAAVGNPRARFNLIGHSMGGLVARYYLRFGAAEPTAPVTWAGAQRIRSLLLVATPNAGAIPALDTILNGSRVGFSSSTLSAAAVAGMPSIYQLVPPAGVPCLLDQRLQTVTADLHDPANWERFGWGPFAPVRSAAAPLDADRDAHRTFARAALARAREIHQALARPAEQPCPARVVALGGDCLPTLARAIVPDDPNAPPRFDPQVRDEVEAMMEAGDGRITRASALAAHLAGADQSETGCGLPEVTQTFFGAADHHGIYGEPTFQNLILRLLMRPDRVIGRRLV